MTENAISSLLDGSHACSINGVLDLAFGGGAVVCVPTGEPGHHMPTLTDWPKPPLPLSLQSKGRCGTAFGASLALAGLPPELTNFPGFC